MESHLLQMRGLKLRIGISKELYKSRIFYRCVDWNKYRDENRQKRKVASFTDAWIETANTGVTLILALSRIFYRCVDWNLSAHTLISPFGVASFTDAWIETCMKSRLRLRTASHLLQMRGLKLQSAFGCRSIVSRIFYRCVDWNPERGTWSMGKESHLLQMRGLKRWDADAPRCL